LEVQLGRRNRIVTFATFYDTFLYVEQLSIRSRIFHFVPPVFEKFTLHPGLYIMAIFTGQIMHILETMWASVLSDN
jgi:hypothetical protein